jgi:putative SOS response-associated peptidase YedK
MCGRFGLVNPKALAERGLLDAMRLDEVGDEAPERLEPRYNIAPSRDLLVALTRRVDGESRRRLTVAKWGLVPAWAKDPKIGGKLCNARSEGVAATPSFRTAWKRGHRCLAPADVFYEWRTTGAEESTLGKRAPREPWAFAMVDDAPFALAGVWESWRDPADPDGPPLVTCSLLTTSANALMSPIHDRMPVIIPPAMFDDWLDRDAPLSRAEALLAPLPAESMRAWRITPWVNDPRHDDPRVLEAAPA